MKKRDYDNALTLLEGNNKKKLKENLYLENDRLLRELASALVELQSFDINSNKMVISESDRFLLEENLFKTLVQKFKNLFNPKTAQVVNSAISNLPPEDQKLLKGASKKIAEKYGKECIDEHKSTYGDDQEGLKLAVQNCLSSKFNDEFKDGGPLQKIFKFFRKPLPKTVISTILLVMVLTKVFPPSKTTTTTDDSGKNKTEMRYDSDLLKKVQNSDDSKTISLADAQGVTAKVKAPIHVPIDFDTGSSKLKPDQQQKINDLSQKVIDNVKNRVESGQKNITVSIDSQGNNSNDGPNANHDNGDNTNNLNKNRSNTAANALDSLVKTLEKMGVKVNLTKSVGDQGKSVKHGTEDSEASESSFISVNIDGQTQTTTTTYGTPWQPERDFPAPEVLGCEVTVPNPENPNKPSKINVKRGDKITFYGKKSLDTVSIKEKTFAGVLDSTFKESAGYEKYDAVILGGFTHDGSVIERGKYMVLDIPTLKGKCGKKKNPKLDMSFMTEDEMGFSKEGPSSKSKPEENSNDCFWLISCGFKAVKQSDEKPKKGEEDVPVKPNKDEKPIKGGEDIPKKPNEDEKPKKGEEEPETEIGDERIPANFLKGNRNMQLAYLASNFLPQKDTFFNKLNLKEGTVIPSGFLDAALGQGSGYKSLNSKNYLKAYYNKLKKDNSFIKNIDVNTWLKLVKSPENQNLIKWVRNTRKSIGPFIQKLRNAFPEFKIGERQKAKVEKPGEEGQAMALAGESLNGRYDLILEVNLNSIIKLDSFNKNQFMKNLPQFMKMLSMMYYGVKGKPLSYDKKAVLKSCKKFGCKEGGANIKYKKTKSGPYKFYKPPRKGDNMSESLKNQNPLLIEEVNKIKNLMFRIL